MKLTAEGEGNVSCSNNYYEVICKQGDQEVALVDGPSGENLHVTPVSNKTLDCVVEVIAGIIIDQEESYDGDGVSYVCKEKRYITDKVREIVEENSRQRAEGVT